MQAWTIVPGFPAVADGPAQQMPLPLTGQARYFRVRELDDQAPVIVSQHPKPDGFAVPRLAGLTVELDDATGVDPASLRLTVEPLGSFTLADPQLSFTNHVLSLATTSDRPLGAFGAKVTASLVAADVLGNRGTNTWSFDLEVEPKVVANLFVFGSGRAQRVGQKVAHLPTAALAQRAGPAPATPGDSWTLEQVAADRLVLAYTGDAPAFVVGTYLSNQTPGRLEEVFYRKITTVSDDPANRRLTLFTTDVPLAEMVERGSLSLAGNAPVYEVDDEGTIIKPAPVARMGEWELARLELGGDWSGEKVFEENGVALTNDVAYIGLTNSLTVALETEWFTLQRFDITLNGDFGAGLKPRLTVNWAGQDAQEVPLGKPLRKLIFVGFLGPVPVWLDANFTVTAGMEYDWSVFGEFTAGVTATAGLELGANYLKDRSPSAQWKWEPRPPEVRTDPFQYEINGAASATVRLVPKLDLRVNSLAGLWVNVDPRLEASGSARVVNHELESAQWRFAALADLNAGLSVIGVDDKDLPRLDPPLRLFTWEKTEVYPATEIRIHRPPQSLTVTEGQSATFSVDATANRPMTFLWYHRAMPVFNRPSGLFDDPRLLVLNPIALGDAGEYWVRIRAGDQVVDSARATLTVRPREPKPIPGMAWIPPGTFQMGDSFGEGWSDERPVHTVTVSGFYMDRCEVTKALWDEVYGWAVGHGYSFDSAGSGKGATHPVDRIHWYDAVKWCNARSQREGRVPAYYTDAGLTAVYTTGQASPHVRWDRGYRLPTEAEWEYAARGGLSGRRFPWGDTIAHSQANYDSYWVSGRPYYDYDVSPTRGDHPTYATGGWPYTSPVGSFGANGYGLYDMAGNVWEWCWDWWGSYGTGSQVDPRGPAGGSDRVIRGGSWCSYARTCRVTSRSHYWPVNRNIISGFRSVLPPGQ